MDSLTPSKLQEVDVSQNLVNGEWTEPRAKFSFITRERYLFTHGVMYSFQKFVILEFNYSYFGGKTLKILQKGNLSNEKCPSDFSPQENSNRLTHDVQAVESALLQQLCDDFYHCSKINANHGMPLVAK